MKQVVFSRRQPATIADVPIPGLRPGTVLVRTHFSAVSVGTEREIAEAGALSLLRKAATRPEQVKQVIASLVSDGVSVSVSRARAALERQMSGGYSNSGVVVAIANDITEFKIGDRVACAGGGYAVHAEYCAVPRRLVARVPDEVGLDEAAFATIGAVAMHGYRTAEPSLGEHVAVIGLGIVGQLLCQIAAAAGTRVVAIDLDLDRVRLASQQIGQPGIVAGSENEWADVLALTGQRGVDAVFVCAATASSTPMQLASRLVRERGRIVVVGDVGMELDRQVLYEKELHVLVSRSYGPGRYDREYEEKGRDYPYSYVRWTEQRNIESVLDLMARGKLRVAPLVTHRVPLAAASEMFGSLAAGSAESPIGALLTYDTSEQADSRQTIQLAVSRHAPTADLGVGLIGPGSFAQSIILPALARNGVAPLVIAAPGGLAPTAAARRFGATRATTDTTTLFEDDRIHCVFVTTRHDSHAGLVVEALSARKSVYVEKPLATTLAQLEEVCSAYNRFGGSVMVGFNRRFAPFTQRLKAHLPAHVPPVINYRVNAGAIDRNHWTVSEDAGAGRIIGEACHFVDLMQFLAASPIVSVQAQALRNGDALEEDVCATLAFENGAIGSLVYTAQGASSISKERLELFAGGKAALLEDFTSLTLASGSKKRRSNARQDKGFDAAVSAFLAHLRGTAPCPIPFEEVVVSTLATIAIVESLRTGEAVGVPRVAVRG